MDCITHGSTAHSLVCMPCVVVMLQYTNIDKGESLTQRTLADALAMGDISRVSVAFNIVKRLTEIVNDMHVVYGCLALHLDAKNVVLLDSLVSNNLSL